jgi:stage II sporulation protein D
MRGFLALLVAVPVAAATVRVRRGGEVAVLDLEKYVAAALAGESSVFRSEEALKAMAVAARTYAVRTRGRHGSEGFDFCDTTHCQRLDFEAVGPRLTAVAEATAGLLLWYEGKPAFACYTRDCGGRTEDAGALWPDLSAPYLRSLADPYCARAGPSVWHWETTSRELTAALRQSELRTPNVIETIAVTRTTGSARARTLALFGGGEPVAVSGSSFRFAVGRALGWNTLRSDRYQVGSAGGRFVFEGSGAGHGVGLCQRGAEQMGLAGRSYVDILAFYYPSTAVGRTARGWSWTRIGGESISVLTTRPDQDAAVLAEAERLLEGVGRQVRRPPPRAIEIRVYPDVETFRNATAEPGSVAAYTEGRTIHLQPPAILRRRGVFERTLYHELLHVAIEEQTLPELPLWFREGLAGFLSGGGHGDATRAVAALIRRYGEDTVLSWLRLGLPRDVTKDSASQAPTKKR